MKLSLKQWNEVIAIVREEGREAEKAYKNQAEVVSDLDKQYSSAHVAEDWKKCDEIKAKYDFARDMERHLLKRRNMLDEIIEQLENQEL